MAKLLPDQFGVSMMNITYTFSDDPDGRKDSALYQKYINAVHIQTGDLTPLINLFKSSPPSTSRMVFFIRDWLLDTIKTYYRCGLPNNPFMKVKADYLKRGPQAYDFLKSSSFQLRIKSLDKYCQPSILISKDLWEDIEYTYTEAKKKNL